MLAWLISFLPPRTQWTELEGAARQASQLKISAASNLRRVVDEALERIRKDA